MTYSAAEILTFAIVAIWICSVTFKLDKKLVARHVVAEFPKMYNPRCFGCNDDGSGCRDCQFRGLRQSQ